MTRTPRLAVALDVADRAAALSAASNLRDHADLLKVGLELFVAEGPAVVAELVAEGWAVFLDLKLHDIPATVAGAVHSAQSLGVEMVTLHASGGRRMIAAAVEARGGGEVPRLLGVTVLTSIDSAELQTLGFSGTVDEGVERLAGVARQGGCDGVVASPHEVAALRSLLGEEPIIVTPGIRPADAAADDQARVATAAAAVAAGADILVVGRPILRAEDPSATADSIRQEMEEAHARRS